MHAGRDFNAGCPPSTHTYLVPASAAPAAAFGFPLAWVCTPRQLPRQVTQTGARPSRPLLVRPARQRPALHPTAPLEFQQPFGCCARAVSAAAAALLPATFDASDGAPFARPHDATGSATDSSWRARHRASTLYKLRRRRFPGTAVARPCMPIASAHRRGTAAAQRSVQPRPLLAQRLKAQPCSCQCGYARARRFNPARGGPCAGSCCLRTRMPCLVARILAGVVHMAPATDTCVSQVFVEALGLEASLLGHSLGCVIC